MIDENTSLPSVETAATQAHSQKKFLEALLVLVTLGMVCLVHLMPMHQVVALHLFFLPIVLAGFYLGQYRAGALALFAVVATSVVVMADMTRFAGAVHPVVLLLQLCVWGGTLGLTAVLVGTLSDDRSLKTVQAREAHRGVAEVLAVYLQAVNPNLQSRALRVADLAEEMGRKLKLTPGDLEDIRVAALMLDFESLEITSRVIRRAVGEIHEEAETRTSAGSDLLQSLGLVLTTAFPIAQSANHSSRWRSQSQDLSAPLGADILRAARAYDQLSRHPLQKPDVGPLDLVRRIAKDDGLGLPPVVVDALGSCVGAGTKTDLISLSSNAPARQFAGIN